MNDQQRGTAPGGADRRIAEELRSTLATYHELGPGYEEQVIESFLDRIRPVLNPPPADAPPLPPMRYRRHRGGRGLFIALVIIIGWLVFAGPLSGHGRYWYGWHGVPGISVAPLTPPGNAVPAQPSGPQFPSSSVQ